MTTEFFKFPSTPHLTVPKGVRVRAEKVLNQDEIEGFLSSEIVIEEKIDGANLGVSFNQHGEIRIQNRGSYLTEPYEGQWKTLRDWLNRKEDILFDLLTDKYILFGEWCYARHSIHYSKLPDWFIVFDVYSKNDLKFLSVDRRNTFIAGKDIKIVPLLGKGMYSFNDLQGFFRKSMYSNAQSEGIYLRQDEKGWLKTRAKMVRNSFIQSNEPHWSSRMIEPNYLSY